MKQLVVFVVVMFGTLALCLGETEESNEDIASGSTEATSESTSENSMDSSTTQKGSETTFEESSENLMDSSTMPNGSEATSEETAGIRMDNAMQTGIKQTKGFVFMTKSFAGGQRGPHLGHRHQKPKKTDGSTTTSSIET